MLPLPTNTLPDRERLVFQQFWNLLAVGSGLASWTLAGWLVDPSAWARPSWHTAVAVLALTGAYRAAAAVLDRPALPAAPIPSLARAVLGVGFASIVTTGSFLGVAGAWAIGQWLAQAGGTLALAGVAAMPSEVIGLPFRGIGVSAIATSLAVQLYGFTIGFRRLQVRELSIPIAGLPAAFEGYRILHISDIHLGPFCHRNSLRSVLATAQALRPDLVCCTGDVIDSPTTDLAGWLPELHRLMAPDGVLTILGNHDRHAGGDRIATALQTMTPWRVLRNESADITRGDDHLYILGIEDAPQDVAANTTRALAATLPPEAVAVALIHHPGVFDGIAPLGLPLVLAGHTHGGQLAVPFAPHVNTARILGIRRTVGAFREGASRMFVSRGIGTSGQRVRVGAPRELTVFRLVGEPPIGTANPLTPAGGAVS